MDSIKESLVELHDYIDETIDSVNQINSGYDSKIKELETSIQDLKSNFGEFMYQLQLQLREIIVQDQESQKQTRLKLKNLGNYINSVSKQYRKQI